MLVRSQYFLISVILFLCFPAYAITILVGPGKGIVWSGSPYSFGVTGTHGNTMHSYSLGLGALYSGGSCVSSSFYEALPEGFSGYKVTTGIYVIARARVNGQLYYGPKKNDPTSAINHIISGTIGYPETKVTDQNGTPWEVTSSWCTKLSDVYPVLGKNKELNISGDWIVYATGDQIPSTTIYKLSSNLSGLIRTIFTPQLGFESDKGEDHLNPLLLSDISVRVIGVQCSINTQINVNFGEVLYNANLNAELASVTSPFSVSCKQGSDPVTVNINASFRANTGYYKGDATQLALSEGGGYITGEIGKGVTGSGACVSHPSSLSFAQVPVKLTTLQSTAPSIDDNNTITWRLCSGGSELPVGNIHASTELSIVFS
ncbi:hypothetical protein [Klebsiella aerogenes]|uniref:hypothetical protein n=1 Tax=Klebsiella aerogenes TaxID=548 RepID=UPI000F7ED93B|nr:hypothetical protein [Klebsiella aerogenes]